jgi:hypothetical protein
LGDKAGPLLRCDFPKTNRIAALVGADRTLTDTRIVDENVNVAKSAERRRDDHIKSRRVAQVGADRMQHPARIATGSRLQLAQPSRLFVDRGDVDPALQQPERHRPPDPARRPGDDCRLPL